MIKVSAVSYLNTKPFLYGIFQKELDKQFDLSLDMPSEGARKLLEGEVDLGLVPVAIIPKLKTPHIISDYCIGAEGAVNTVAIFSEVPIDQLTHLYLDYQSRTSVQLAQVLLREYWQLSPELLPAYEGFEKELSGTVGGVIIGDRTIGLTYAFKYDLGHYWTVHTGLPFVFAAWVSNRKLPASFIKIFNEALDFGLSKLHQLAYLVQSPDDSFSIYEYYTRYIKYHLDEPKKEGLALFLNKIQQYAGVEEEFVPQFF